MRWIFSGRLAGRSVAVIARELNERGVLCPSAADPGRNRHRGGQAWNLRSVAVILVNPRYTGGEVWPRHQCAKPGGGRRVIPAELAQRLMIDGDACESDVLEMVAHMRSRTTVIVHYRTGRRVAARDEA